LPFHVIFHGDHYPTWVSDRGRLVLTVCTSTNSIRETVVIMSNSSERIRCIHNASKLIIRPVPGVAKFVNDLGSVAEIVVFEFLECSVGIDLFGDEPALVVFEARRISASVDHAG